MMSVLTLSVVLWGLVFVASIAAFSSYWFKNLAPLRYLTWSIGCTLGLLSLGWHGLNWGVFLSIILLGQMMLLSCRPNF